MIEIKNLSKSFHNHEVLNQLNLTIQTGETMVVIGRSGVGKTVLLKNIIGLLKPDSGEVLIDGQDITKLEGKELDKIRLKFGMLFQGSALFDSLTVKENVGFSLKEHTRQTDEQIDQQVKEALDLVGLTGIESLMPAELSGGMKKRVGFARAICMRPDIILYDEPTTGVDPIMADTTNELIMKLHDRLKITAIAVTHDMTSAYKIADRIAMLYNGKIIALGTPQQIKKTTDPVVHQFITGEAWGPITRNKSSYVND
jgi:phospholipid/cholesterol/gamma-HCH transport system ATP-binding protein